MSAVLAVQHADRVQILSDAFAGRAGTITAIRSKIRTSVRSRIAFAFRGDAVTGAWLCRSFAFHGWLHGSFDRTFAHVEEYLAKERSSGQRLRFAEIFVAGISETRGPITRVFYTTGHGGIEAFKFYMPPKAPDGTVYFWSGPRINNIMFRLSGGLEATGAAIMDQARATAAVDLVQGGEPFLAVGGFAELVTVTAAGVTRQKVREWPEDKVGHKINPTAVHDSPPTCGVR